MKTIITGSGEDETNQRIAGFITESTIPVLSIPVCYTTIGLIDEGKILAGLLYHDFTASNIITHVAAIPGRRWLNRALLWYGFYYPFIELGCSRLTGFVRSDNDDSLRMAYHLGYEIEAVLKGTFGPNVNTIILVMWRENCRWLTSKEKRHGDGRTITATAT